MYSAMLVVVIALRVRRSQTTSVHASDLPDRSCSKMAKAVYVCGSATPDDPHTKIPVLTDLYNYLEWQRSMVPVSPVSYPVFHVVCRRRSTSGEIAIAGDRPDLKQ